MIGDDKQKRTKPRVLVVTVFRPEEVVEPLEHADLESTVIRIDQADGIVERNVQTLRRTRDAIHKGDPDLILLDVHETVGVMVALLSLWYRIPLVERLVGDRWREYREEKIGTAKRQRAPIRFTLYALSILLNELIHQRTVGYIVVSVELKRIVQDRTGCPPERIAVVPVPISEGTESTVDARERLGIKEETIILTVTNLKYRGKFEGVRRILGELEGVLAVNEEVGYVIAGDGEYLSHLKSYIDETIEDESVRRRIYTLGFVDDVESLSSCASIFAYVSYIDGYPNAVLEAQAAGLPVVANAAHGMMDQIEDGETGFLIDPAEPGEIKSKIQYLLDTPDERVRLGRNAQKRVRRENDPKVLGPQLERALGRIYERIPR